MQFFDEMTDKFGFNDGESMPGGVGEYREVYLRAINAFARKHGSQQRMIAWDRSGMHNGFMVLKVTRKYFDSLQSDDERYVTGPTNHLDEAEISKERDAGLIHALSDAMDAELDQYLDVRVTIARDGLNAALCRVTQLMAGEDDKTKQEASQDPAPSRGKENDWRNSIAKILLAHGESFLADKGVDPRVCQQVAAEIIDVLQRQAIRVLIAMRGGVLQGALADLPNIMLELYDYDVFETEPKNDQGRSREEAEKQWQDAQTVMHAVF